MEIKEMVESYGFSTKSEMLAQLQAYLKNPDDDTVRIKDKIKDMLINCPKLLWALNDKTLSNQLFDEDGNLACPNSCASPSASSTSTTSSPNSIGPWKRFNR